MQNYKKINFNYSINIGCNIQCKHCYLPLLEKKDTEEKILKSFKELILKMKNENYIFNYVVFNGYEPTLLHGSYYRKMLDYCLEIYGMYFINKFSIQTNGIDMNSFFDYIGQEEMTINFSLDFLEQFHDSTREKKSWEKTMFSLLQAKEFDYDIIVTCLISNEIYYHFNDFLKFIQWCHQLNIKIVLKPFIPNKNTNITLSGKEAFELGKLFLQHGLYKYTTLFSKNACSINGNNCFSLEFDSQGNVYTCNKGHNEEYIFANWKENTLEEIINIRKDLFKDIYQNQKCYQCEYLTLCYGGCPINRDDGKNIYCDFLKGFYSYAKELKAFSFNAFFN